jgi:hypothetical protein
MEFALLSPGVKARECGGVWIGGNRPENQGARIDKYWGRPLGNAMVIPPVQMGIPRIYSDLSPF